MSTLYFCFQKLFASCYLARGLICLSLFWRHATIRSRTRTKDILPSCCFLEGKKGKNLKIFVKRICRFYIAHMWITEHLQIFKILARFKGNQIMNNNLHKYFVWPYLQKIEMFFFFLQLHWISVHPKGLNFSKVFTKIPQTQLNPVEFSWILKSAESSWIQLNSAESWSQLNPVEFSWIQLI